MQDSLDPCLACPDTAAAASVDCFLNVVVAEVAGAVTAVCGVIAEVGGYRSQGSVAATVGPEKEATFDSAEQIRTDFLLGIDSQLRVVALEIVPSGLVSWSFEEYLS